MFVVCGLTGFVDGEAGRVNEVALRSGEMKEIWHNLMQLYLIDTIG